ncbi:DUF3829 domain-containing protein, partial [Escherichia coli]
KLQVHVQHSLARYADWLRDFKQGPTGKELHVYGIYSIRLRLHLSKMLTAAEKKSELFF